MARHKFHRGLLHASQRLRQQSSLPEPVCSRGPARPRRHLVVLPQHRTQRLVDVDPLLLTQLHTLLPGSSAITLACTSAYAIISSTPANCSSAGTMSRIRTGVDGNGGCGMRRQALVVGVEGPATNPADESPPRWQQLTYAAPYTQRLREVLEKQYTYILLEPNPDPASTAAALGDALTHAVSGEADFTIIHVLAHGEPTPNSHGIRAVGGDGRLTETLTRWVDLAENRTADGAGAPSVLLILDLCHSGAVATEHLRSLVRPERRRVWVLAACHSDQRAYDGRLSLAVDDVLRGFASGALKLDESLPYIPIDRFCREVTRHVEDQSADHYPQTVERPLAALGDDLSHLRFFANPRHDPTGLRSRGGVDPAVFTLLDEVADARHFAIRAHGADSAFGDFGNPAFTGRSDELRELTRWLEGEGASVQVVTGAPGVGKSALIGALVCAAHPALREATEQLWRPSRSDIPAAVDGLAVVHARRRSIPEILSSLAAQWAVNSPGRGAPWTTDQLVTALRARPEPPCLIVDAVDEAEHPADLVTAVLMPLAAIQRSDGRPLCKMLDATRSGTRAADRGRPHARRADQPGRRAGRAAAQGPGALRLPCAASFGCRRIAMVLTHGSREPGRRARRHLVERDA
jgi:hypothetical protein